MTWCNAKIKEQAPKETRGDHKKIWKSSEASVSGRYNTPPLQEDLVPRSRMAPDKSRRGREEVKLIASLTNEWNQRTLRGRKAWRNDTTEVNKIYNIPFSKRNKDHCENLCRLKNMKQELNGSKGIWKHTGRKEKQGTPCEPWSLQSYEWREQWTRSTCKHSGWNEMYKER